MWQHGPHDLESSEKKIIQDNKVNRFLKNGLECSKPGNLCQYWEYSIFGRENHVLGERTGQSGLLFGILNKEAQ